MKKIYVDCFLENMKADEMLISVLKKFPDEAFEPLMEIKERTFDEVLCGLLIRYRSFAANI